MSNSQILKKKKIPDGPGVYMFLGRNRHVLYVGRASSLRSRVKSYFSQDIQDKRGPKILTMVEKAKTVDWKKTDSVMEAILLEADLIKKFKPLYNTDAKDDKSWNCVVITKEDYPRVLIIRERDLDSKLMVGGVEPKAVFGPFPEGAKLKEVLKFIRKVFPYRDNKCTPCSIQRNSAFSQRRSAGCKSCFNRQIGLCPGVCDGGISKRDYSDIIKNIELVFKNRKKKLLTKLARDMSIYAKRGEFEKAASARDAIRAFKSVNDVALISAEPDFSGKRERIEGFDVAHISGGSAVGIMVSILNGRPDKKNYRKFILKGDHGGNDISAMKELLERRFRHKEWGFPDIVAVDGGLAQKRTAEAVLKKMVGKSAPDVVAVVKDEKHRPKKILGQIEVGSDSESNVLLADVEAHRFALSFHRKLRGRNFLAGLG